MPIPLPLFESQRYLALVCVGVALSAVTGCQPAAEEIVLRPAAEQGSDYVIQEGDDLASLAARAYGEQRMWWSLLNANQHLKFRPNFKLEVGESIHIPLFKDANNSMPKSEFPETLPADYVVLPGDSLHFIALRCYGDRELWPVIYNANRDTLSSAVAEDTRRLIAGQLLHIPARPEDIEAE
ncbi:MAG: LysM peptidoglycan-binding domain-containing protein [Pirellulales bacterium]|nr:LysM peptidoglycan-binding domain-containing protein [Pirellulales bacterium]